jgi:hypothetical protein
MILLTRVHDCSQANNDMAAQADYMVHILSLMFVQGFGFKLMCQLGGGAVLAGLAGPAMLQSRGPLVAAFSGASALPPGLNDGPDPRLRLHG